ncbi:MAG: response regulator [Planctomycetes bacterium]|nr:response regulator [Planctomycetota bacterium]MBL7007446.1 response regulator [Planctomycetota bacterium]
MKPFYIVEDDPLIRRYLLHLLTRVMKVQVIEWTEGQDVIATVEAEQPPLVLLDITLRGATLDGRPTDGLALCRRIKEQLGDAAPPVMLLTAHAVEGDRERFLGESGADDYQAKPIFDENDFLDRMAKLVAG